MNPTLAQTIATIALVGTSAGLSLAVLTARQPVPVRVGFDLLRIVISVVTIVVMAAVTGISTPGTAVAAAVALGGALGYAQGRSFRVDERDGRMFVTRTAFAVIVWGAGIVLMQVAGMASRSGLVQLGQAVAWFGVGNTIGTFGGRTAKIDEVRRALAVSAAAVAVVMSGGVVLIASPEPALAFHGGEHPGCVADGTGGYFCGPVEPDSQVDLCELTGECALPTSDTGGRSPIFDGCDAAGNCEDVNVPSPSPPSPAPAPSPPPPSASSGGGRSGGTGNPEADQYCRDRGFDPDFDGDGACDLPPGAADQSCRDRGFLPDSDGDGVCDQPAGAGDRRCRDAGFAPDRNGDGYCDIPPGAGDRICRDAGFAPDRDGDGICDIPQEQADQHCRDFGYEPDRDGDGYCDLEPGAADDYCRDHGLDPDRNQDGVCDLSAEAGAAFCTERGFEPDADGDGVCDVSEEALADHCITAGYAPDADGDGVCDFPEGDPDSYCVSRGFAPDADGDGICDIPDDGGAAYCVAEGFAPDADGDGVCDLPLQTASVTTAPIGGHGDDASTVDPDENAAQSAGGSAGAGLIGLSGLVETLGRGGSGGRGGNGGNGGRGSSGNGPGTAGSGSGTGRRTTVYLSGEDAEAFLEQSRQTPVGQTMVGEEIPIPEDQRHGLDIEGGGSHVQEDPIGSRGRVLGIGPRVEGPDGETVIAVEVEVTDPSVAPSAPAPDPTGSEGSPLAGEGATSSPEDPAAGPAEAPTPPPADTYSADEIDRALDQGLDDLAGLDLGHDDAPAPTDRAADTPPTPDAPRVGGPDLEDGIDRGMDTFSGLDLGGTQEGDPAGDTGGTWLDVDGDLDPETVAGDFDGDGTPEYLSDTDADGRADTLFVDTDGDGTPDTAIAYDPATADPPADTPPTPATTPDAGDSVTDDDRPRFDSSAPPDRERIVDVEDGRGLTDLTDPTGARSGAGDPTTDAPPADPNATTQRERSSATDAPAADPNTTTQRARGAGDDAVGRGPADPNRPWTDPGERARSEAILDRVGNQPDHLPSPESIAAGETPSVHAVPGVANDGSVHSPSGHRIGMVDADGRVTDLDGRPVDLVVNESGRVVGLQYPPTTEGGRPVDVVFDSRGNPRVRTEVYGGVDAQGRIFDERGDLVGQRNPETGEAEDLQGRPLPDAPTRDLGQASGTPDVWEHIRVDPDGRVYDLDGNHIGNRSPSGEVRDLRGVPMDVRGPSASDPREPWTRRTGAVSEPVVQQQALGAIEHSEPGPDQPRPRSEPTTRSRLRPREQQVTGWDPRAGQETTHTVQVNPRDLWDRYSAGPNGELTGPDGRQVGIVDGDGTVWTGDRPGQGQRVTDVTMNNGRVVGMRTEDGTWHGASGSAPAGPRETSSETLLDRMMNQPEPGSSRVGTEIAPPVGPDQPTDPDRPVTGESPRPTSGDDPRATGETPRPTSGDDPVTTRQADRPTTAPDDGGRAGQVDAPTGRQRAIGAMGRILDAKQAHDLYQQHLRDGMSPSEALAATTAQMGAAEAVGRSAGMGLQTGFAGGALLPGGMQNVMPDQFAINAAGTAADFVRAAATSLGEGDTRALSEFWDSVVNRGGGDPFSGYAQAAQMAWDEWNRSDGGNLASDLYDLYVGENADVGWGEVGDGLGEFHERLRSGEYGAPLQGLTQIGDATLGTAAEFVGDPTGTMERLGEDAQQLGRDLATMARETFQADSMLFDGELWQEFGANTEDAIRRTPMVGALYDLGGSAASYLRSFF